jgi:hypothetical protein
MYYYATVIQKLQKELGLRISSFPDLALMAQEYIDDDSECGTNTEEMTGEEILQLLMKHDREFLDKYEREHRKEYVFYRKWQHASLYQSFMSRETSRQININRGKQFLH